MDAYQILNLVLMVLIAATAVTGVVVLHRASVRQESSAVQLQTAIGAIHQQCSQVLTELKGTLPAIEHSNDGTRQLAVEILGQLRTLDKTAGDTLSELRRQTGLIDEGNLQSVAIEGHLSRFSSILTDLTKAAGALEKLTREGASTLEQVSRGTNAISKTASDQVSVLHNLEGEIASLRQALVQATTF